jgi:Domain of unknown function (DUF4294)
MKNLLFIFFILFANLIVAQNSNKIKYTKVLSDKDTLIGGLIPEVIVRERPQFSNGTDYATYMRYKRYAEHVYPYAVQAVKAYKELKDSTEQLGFFARRRYVKDKQAELKSKFEDPLINLTKGQGKLLIKMIERKLQVPMYDVISDTKGGFTATYWNILGKTSGYHLKRGYVEGEDRILDLVIDDYNIPD